jgi:signal peptidase
VIRTALTKLKAVAAIGFVAAAVGLVVVSVVLPRAIGGAALTVLSGSMTPTHPVGSLVVVRPVDPAQIEVGDVITFVKEASSSDVTTHRVVEIKRDAAAGTTFVTKGDANPQVDSSPVAPEAVRGRVWFHIPVVGYLRSWLTSTVGLVGIAAVAGVVLLADRLHGRAAAGAAAAQPRRSRRTRGAASEPEPVTISHGLLVLHLPWPSTPGVDAMALLALWRADVLRADGRGIDAYVAGDPAHLDVVEAAVEQLGGRRLDRSAIDLVLGDVAIDWGPAGAGDLAAPGHARDDGASRLLVVALRADRDARAEAIGQVQLLGGRVTEVLRRHVVAAFAGTQRRLGELELVLEELEVAGAFRSPVPHLDGCAAPGGSDHLDAHAPPGLAIVPATHERSLRLLLHRAARGGSVTSAAVAPATTPASVDEGSDDARVG